jgi:hypothetical protein
LPAEYFDYLTVRVLQLEVSTLDFATSPVLMQSWSRSLQWIRSLKSALETPKIGPDLQYQSVLNQGRLQAGVLHQILHAYLRAGFINESIDAFSEIQQLVDSNKLEVISSFLDSPIESAMGFFNSRFSQINPDYHDSYGRLPFYKLAAVLDMVTENQLVGLGQWMLYSQDVDGPVIPSASHRHPSMTKALARYAAACNDTTLMKRVLQASTGWRLYPSVTYLRTLFNVHVRELEFSEARMYLDRLMQSIGGGHNPEMIANVAAVILDMESKGVAWKKDDATLLMSNMLEGTTGESFGTFTQQQRNTFKQQVGYLLRICNNIACAELNAIARKYMDRFPTGNTPSLSPETFNTMLQQVVTSLGPAQGRRLWEMFCQDPASALKAENAHSRGNGTASADSHEMEVLGADIEKIAEETSSSSAAQNSFNATLSPNPYFTHDTNSKPTPVVIPNIKTVRIIIRGARAELAIEQNQQRRSGLTDLLRWAGRQLHAFGRTEAYIRRELQMAETGAEDALFEEDAMFWAPARESEAVDVSREFGGNGVARLSGERPPGRHGFRRIFVKA